MASVFVHRLWLNVSFDVYELGGYTHHEYRMVPTVDFKYCVSAFCLARPKSATKKIGGKYCEQGYILVLDIDTIIVI